MYLKLSTASFSLINSDYKLSKYYLKQYLLKKQDIFEKKIVEFSYFQHRKPLIIILFELDHLYIQIGN
jgi:hypothetical protein